MKERAVIGPFMKSCDPALVETAGYAGMDFVILDMEHGPAGMERLQELVRAAQLTGTLPVVRVDECKNISKALDIGAAGVQVPQVADAETAFRAVREAKYYPEGERGICRFVRAAEYSAKERQAYFEEANKSLVIIQAEGLEAIKNLDKIMEVKGVDILFIGPYDLSQSLGIPGQITHTEVVRQMREIILKAQAKGILTGVFVDSKESLQVWKDAGVKYISYSVDMGIFYDACCRIREAL